MFLSQLINVAITAFLIDSQKQVSLISSFFYMKLCFDRLFRMSKNLKRNRSSDSVSRSSVNLDCSEIDSPDKLIRVGQRSNLSANNRLSSNNFDSLPNGVRVQNLCEIIFLFKVIKSALRLNNLKKAYFTQTLQSST